MVLVLTDCTWMTATDHREPGSARVKEVWDFLGATVTEVWCQRKKTKSGITHMVIRRNGSSDGL